MGETPGIDVDMATGMEAGVITGALGDWDGGGVAAMPEGTNCTSSSAKGERGLSGATEFAGTNVAAGAPGAGADFTGPAVGAAGAGADADANNGEDEDARNG